MSAESEGAGERAGGAEEEEGGRDSGECPNTMRPVNWSLSHVYTVLALLIRVRKINIFFEVASYRNSSSENLNSANY